MTRVRSSEAAADRVVAALISGLALEFGRHAGEALAQRFLDAEEADFHWEARVRERWLGSYEGADEDGFALDRVAIFGSIEGEWFVAQCIVDGEGCPHGLLGRRAFRSERTARRAFADAH